MLLPNKMPLSKEQLLSFVCNIIDQSNSCIAIIDQQDSNLPILYYNESFSELTGYINNELIGKNLRSLRGIKTDPEIESEIDLNIKSQLPVEINIIHYHKDGSPFWNYLYSLPIKDETNEVQFTLICCKNITDQMLDKMLSKLEREVYAELDKGGDTEVILQLIAQKIEMYYIRSVYCAIRVLDSTGELKVVATGSLPSTLIESINAYIIEPTAGFNEKAVYIDNVSHKQIELNNNIYNDISSLEVISCWTKPIVNQHHHILGSITIYLKDQASLKQSDLEFLNKLSPIITLSLKYAEQKQELERLAFYDMNTGIPNQNYFYTNLTEWIEGDFTGIILIIQPGEYSGIVDLYGRKTGDELLIQIANRLKNHQKVECNEDIIYGRFSNSSIITAKKIYHDKIDLYVSRLRQELTTSPYVLADREMFISLNIGIAHFGNGVLMEESIRQADIALTSSRKKFGTVITFFEEETNKLMQQEMDTLNQLIHGLKNNEFSAFLQPKVNLKTAEIEGFEALARWHSPVLGSVSPATFIPIAEYSGKIREIDNAILKQVLKWQQARKEKGLKLVPVSVNISPVHFYHDTFVDDFISLVHQYHISPEYIKVEVTENFELVDFEKAKSILIRLKEYGYESSIDDFGVGFSSLSYLQQLPFSEIKIDQSFISNMNNDEMFAVVQTIIQLASRLKMHAVAEGIETVDQYNLLKNIGCNTGQGYYFHKPMPINEAEKLLNNIK